MTANDIGDDIRSSGHIKTWDDLDLHYEIRGDIDGSSPILVILNNFFMEAGHWEPFTRQIRKHFAIVNYDLRHQGRSGRVKGDIELQHHVDDLKCLIAGLGLERVSLLGTCISTMIGKEAALQIPDAIERMVLVGPIFSPFGGLFRKFLHRTLIASLEAGGAEALFDHYYPMLYTARTIENNRAVGYLALKTRFVESNPKEQLLKHLSSTVELQEDIADLKRIGCPTLLLCGEEDFLASRQSLGLLRELIPDCSLTLLESAGHNPYVEATAAFEREVLTFLLAAEEQPFLPAARAAL